MIETQEDLDSLLADLEVVGLNETPAEKLRRLYLRWSETHLLPDVSRTIAASNPGDWRSSMDYSIEDSRVNSLMGDWITVHFFLYLKRNGFMTDLQWFGPAYYIQLESAYFVGTDFKIVFHETDPIHSSVKSLVKTTDFVPYSLQFWLQSNGVRKIPIPIHQPNL